MKLTKTYYYQFGNQFTPTSLYSDFPSPSGEYSNPLDEFSTASIYINVPFKVKTIKVKNLTYTAGMNSQQGITMPDGTNLTSQADTFVTFVSSLIGNRPVGMVHQDSFNAMNTSQNISHTFQIPEVINGYYDFVPYNNFGVVIDPVTAGVSVVLPDPPVYFYFFDSFSITLEFEGEKDL